ncbi:MAG: UDP-N-acetylglucosamine--N-acetylmuramyl-(pentapeptide) pyrophosphoryl-undecaprenol N-acetylglucosamine transferase [Bacilli bacterium]|nr:UDP-N-acetylglucosamine--N-acetylmuramyl-(pentapeptide) pyrophosphoryl-undecaprenol N-acetylglucosamine transferase [Bacilli bacterium]
MKTFKKILLVSSSSGGHIFPCLVFGEYLKKKNYQVQYLGIKNQMEEKYLYPITLLDIPNSFKKSMSIYQIKKLIKEKKHIQTEIEKADAIYCFGGYISFLVSIINIKYRKKIFMHEQNVVLGDSLKFSYPFIDKIFLSFDNSLKNRKKCIYSSNPTTTKILSRKDVDIKNPKVLFVFGSLSSLTCLKVVKQFLIKTTLPNSFLVVCGKYSNLFKDIKKENVLIKEFVDMKEILKEYDLVFTRGGGTTLSELLKANVEISCIPSPYVKNNHQYKNAEFLNKKGLISLIEEKDFTSERINQEIINLKRKNNYMNEINPLEIMEREIKDD